MNILKNGPIFEKRAKAIAHGFFPYSFFIIVSRITWARNKINQSKGEKENEKTDVHVHVINMQLCIITYFEVISK